MLNYTVSEFKSLHKSKRNVLFYHSLNSNGEKDVKNLNVQPGLPFENKEQHIDKFKNYTLPPLNFLKKNLEINDLKKDENEKSEKNSKTNQGGSYRRKLAMKYKKPKTRGDKNFNRRKKK